MRKAVTVARTRHQVGRRWEHCWGFFVGQPMELCSELQDIKSMFCPDFVSRPRRLMLTMFVQTEWKRNLVKNNYYPCSQSALLLLEANRSSSQKQIKLTITFGHHLLYVRARSCRFICKAVVEIGWSCCYVRWYRRSGYDYA